MTFISNPLGSGGYNTQPLENMTAGLESLQRTEIEKRLRDIEQNKQWKRDQDVANERWALSVASSQTNDDIRAKNIQKFIKTQEEYDNYLSNLLKETNGSPSLPQKVEIEKKKAELSRMARQGSIFADAFDEYQKWFIRTEPTIKGESAKKDFYEKNAKLIQTIKDPNQEFDTSMLYDAMRVPDPDARTLFVSDKSIYDDIISTTNKPGANGTVIADKPKAIQKIKGFIDYNPNSTYQKGIEEGIWKNEDEYAEAAYNLSQGSIKTDATEFAPRTVRTTPKEETDTNNFLNDFAEGAARANPDILKQFSGMVDKEVGTISSAGYDDGKLYLYPANAEKYKPIAIPLPKPSDTTSRLQFKRNLLSRFNQVGSTDIGRKQLNAIQAKWGDGTAVEPDMPLTLKSVVNQLNVSPDEIEKKTKLSTPENVITAKDYRNKIIDSIKKNVNEATVGASKWKFLRTGGDNILEITDNDGKKIEYDLREESDRKKLSDWIVENSKYKEKFKEKFGYGATGKPNNTQFEGVPEGGF